MMGLVAVVCVVGIPAVGLMLVVAFLIVPCAAARLWSVRLFDVLLISGLIGGISGWFGAALSSSLPNLPTGPVIVLVAGAIFVFSLFFAPRRGLVSSQWNAYCRNQRIAEDHALEHFIEHEDAVPNDGLSVLFSVRGWSARKNQSLDASTPSQALCPMFIFHLVVDANGKISRIDHPAKSPSLDPVSHQSC